jgi:uncharacterized protein YggE
MNKTNFSLLFFFFFFSLTIYSQEKSPVIEVTGNAEIKIEADEMDMYLTVNVNMDDLQDAKNRNDASTSQVLDVLKNLNIPDKDISTGGIRIVKNYGLYSKEKKYTVTNDIYFKTNLVSLYEELTSKLIKIEDVYINNTVLSSTKVIETRIKARENALLAARKKAEEMAAVLNMTAGKPIMIQENPGYFYPSVMNNVSEISSYTGTQGNQETFKAGMVNVTSNVKVIFLLLDK